ncbi:MAG: OsmC family protein [Lactobacillus sp.]|jgi:uncharacterized OsmC-like protein|nr:OsmC family protein [Lactobacillus sp.]MCH3906079.1 OsmC family protein [Lactobacillus sp.]MCH3990347.1 OsmC family protein [Lactobacillus sp.]MCH4068938.1 OsmC family protein [Lactobacillus sp.]MCI1303340.1 OsmC family protein [Lactobacillus sp.]
MSKYQVETKFKTPEWQVLNQAAGHDFICDANQSAPGPVDYFASAVNSCIAISARMVAKSKDVSVKAFDLNTTAETSNLGHGLSKITALTIRLHLATDLDPEAEQEFIDHVLHVSTVYQTVKDILPIQIKRI